jgi:acyl-coenzyme A synthetase/AMP-(fatty) acid ligase
MSGPATVPGLLAEAARAAPGAPALVGGGATLTFGAWDRQADQVAAGLRAAGVAGHEAVWLDLPGRHPLLPGAYLGVLRAGNVAVLGGGLAAGQLELAAGRANPRVAAVVTGGGPAPPGLPALDVAELLGRAGPAPAAPDPGPAADADICFTSGTTGGPRGVVSSHGLLHALATVGTPPPGSGPAGGLWHPFGLDTSQGRILALMAIASRRTTVAARGGGRGAPGELEAHRPAHVYVSPYGLRSLGRAATRAFASVRAVTMVTDAATGADLDLARRLFPNAEVGTEYGTTEAGVACTKLVYGQGPAGSVGRPAAGTELRVGDGPAGQPGQGPVLLRAPGVPPARYWDDPAASAATFLPGGWVRTGDLGRLDAGGYLHLLGRADDVVISGGRNLSAGALAERIAACPGVRECAVLGRPNPLLGSSLVAALVLDPGASLPAVRRGIRAALAAHELPAAVVALPALPRNRTGKVDRAALARAVAAQEAGPPSRAAPEGRPA